jgi:hypothetical protein
MKDLRDLINAPRNTRFLSAPLCRHRERKFFIGNLLVRIHFMNVIIRWTGLAPWEFKDTPSHSPGGARLTVKHSGGRVCRKSTTTTRGQCARFVQPLPSVGHENETMPKAGGFSDNIVSFLGK